MAFQIVFHMSCRVHIYHNATAAAFTGTSSLLLSYSLKNCSWCENPIESHTFVHAVSLYSVNGHVLYTLNLTIERPLTQKHYCKDYAEVQIAALHGWNTSCQSTPLHCPTTNGTEPWLHKGFLPVQLHILCTASLWRPMRQGDSDNNWLLQLCNWSSIHSLSLFFPRTNYISEVLKVILQIKD